MKVDFTIGDLEVQAKCQCGHVSFGDSASDAFHNWWEHKAKVHGDEET